MIPLEKGLTYYYEQQHEFERKGIPIEKQVALAYEAGFETGRALLRIDKSNRKRYDLMWVPED